MTIHNGIASLNAFILIEAMPLGIVTHSFGMLTMTYLASRHAKRRTHNDRTWVSLPERLLRFAIANPRLTAIGEFFFSKHNNANPVHDNI